MEEKLRYDLRNTSLGEMLVAATGRGVCWVRFERGRRSQELLLAGLQEEFPWATLERQPGALRPWVHSIVDAIAGRPGADVPLDVRGSQFQRRIWDALCKIPLGETRSYGEVAQQVGSPGAARAVGRACATNPVPILVPCHRVVRSDGGLGGFLGGVQRKRELLRNEQTQVDPAHQGQRANQAVSTNGRPRVTTIVSSCCATQDRSAVRTVHPSSSSTSSGRPAVMIGSTAITSPSWSRPRTSGRG